MVPTVFSGNNLSQSKCDTFQSCTENSQFDNSTQINDSSFKSFNNSFTSPNNGQNSQLSRSSIKDLKILFDSNARFYTYNPESSIWCLQGNAQIQVIADDGLSKKGITWICIFKNEILDFQKLFCIKESINRIFYAIFSTRTRQFSTI